MALTKSDRDGGTVEPSVHLYRRAAALQLRIDRQLLTVILAPATQGPRRSDRAGFELGNRDGLDAGAEACHFDHFPWTTRRPGRTVPQRAVASLSPALDDPGTEERTGPTEPHADRANHRRSGGATALSTDCRRITTRTSASQTARTSAHGRRRAPGSGGPEASATALPDNSPAATSIGGACRATHPGAAGAPSPRQGAGCPANAAAGTTRVRRVGTIA